MIRRRPDGAGSWLLVTQRDHARLAGVLAARLGGAVTPVSRDFIPDFPAAVALHDEGWPDHDDAPTTDDRGHPRDVFSSPADLALRVWEASAARAEAASPHAGLLTGIHVLRLHYAAEASRAQPPTRPEAFRAIKFANLQADRQLRLRRLLGLPIHHSTHGGLAVEPFDTHPTEQALAHAFGLLRLCDVVSLALCYGTPPLTTTPTPVSPGGRRHTFRLARVGADAITVTPWPFDADAWSGDVPARRLPDTTYTHTTLQAAYAHAPHVDVAWRVVRT